MDNTKPVCIKCDAPMSVHPISEELTCFVHGNPNGSDVERFIWAEYMTRVS